MSEINVNIVEKTIKANRTPLSMIGGNLLVRTYLVHRLECIIPITTK